MSGSSDGKRVFDAGGLRRGRVRTGASDVDVTGKSHCRVSRGQDDEADAACLTGLLERDLELGTSVHLDDPHGEGHAGHESVEETCGCSVARLKRTADIEHSGRSLPGHGGIMDRMGSLMWTLAIFYHLVALASGSTA